MQFNGGSTRPHAPVNGDSGMPAYYPQSLFPSSPNLEDQFGSLWVYSKSCGCSMMCSLAIFIVLGCSHNTSGDWGWAMRLVWLLEWTDVHASMICVHMVTFGLWKIDSEMGFMSHVLSEYLVIDKAECLFGMRSTRCKAMEVWVLFMYSSHACFYSVVCLSVNITIGGWICRSLNIRRPREETLSIEGIPRSNGILIILPIM